MPCPSVQTKLFLSWSKSKLSWRNILSWMKILSNAKKSLPILFKSKYEIFGLGQNFLSRTRNILFRTILILFWTKMILSKQKDEAINQIKKNLPPCAQSVSRMSLHWRQTKDFPCTRNNCNHHVQSYITYTMRRDRP